MTGLPADVRDLFPSVTFSLTRSTKSSSMPKSDNAN
jgi:hypothetical protein